MQKLDTITVNYYRCNSDINFVLDELRLLERATGEKILVEYDGHATLYVAADQHILNNLVDFFYGICDEEEGIMKPSPLRLLAEPDLDPNEEFISSDDSPKEIDLLADGTVRLWWD